MGASVSSFIRNRNIYPSHMDSRGGEDSIPLCGWRPSQGGLSSWAGSFYSIVGIYICHIALEDVYCSTEKDYLVYSQYLSSMCVGTVCESPTRLPCWRRQQGADELVGSHMATVHVWGCSDPHRETKFWLWWKFAWRFWQALTCTHCTFAPTRRILAKTR